MGICLGLEIGICLCPNKTVSHRKEPEKYCLRGAMLQVVLQVIKGIAIE
jgi:hypothetical protein